ncbi:60S ribosomal protein L9-A [Bifiguratus adelaidae]|uniref:60S ribosomal protein L9-A n=1 Tax=Bifiguratus adelaidae TaxID=1938954 RepID=A0A261Y1Y0_9FUNG|nr:60S ribosomal protein L9-A [Bifiguratus adelaidae]
MRILEVIIPTDAASEDVMSSERHIYKDEELTIPDNVEVTVKARQVHVKGPRGELSRNLRHIDLEIQFITPKKLRFIVWHGNRKHVACIRTVRSLINNMIIGVTKGFQYKMRYVYAHFPINVAIPKEGEYVEIRNFLGEKVIRKIPILEGVKVEVSTAQKDELILTGNSIENVSQSAANIQQSCRVKRKDIRKFLDGIYISERNVLEDN